MSKPTPATCKTTNWPAYNAALKRRGSLTIRFDPEMRWDAAPAGKRGRRQTYSDAAVQKCLTMKVPFGMVDIGSAIGPSDNADAQDHDFRAEPVEAGRPGLDGAGFQHPVTPPGDPRHEHPLSRL